MDEYIRRDVYYSALVKGLKGFCASIRNCDDRYRYGKSFNDLCRQLLDLEFNQNEGRLVNSAEKVSVLLREMTEQVVGLMRETKMLAEDKNDIVSD